MHARALDYPQSRGFMAFMANQTPLYKEEMALLRQLGAKPVSTDLIAFHRERAAQPIS